MRFHRPDRSDAESASTLSIRSMNDPAERSAREILRRAIERLAGERTSDEAEGSVSGATDAQRGAGDQRSLADEVREVQEGRRRRAESAAIRSSEDIEDVLAKTYAAAAERRAEERAEYLLEGDPIEETPLGLESAEDAPHIEVRRDPA